MCKGIIRSTNWNLLNSKITLTYFDIVLILYSESTPYLLTINEEEFPQLRLYSKDHRYVENPILRYAPTLFQKSLCQYL